MSTMVILATILNSPVPIDQARADIFKKIENYTRYQSEDVTICWDDREHCEPIFKVRYDLDAGKEGLSTDGPFKMTAPPPMDNTPWNGIGAVMKGIKDITSVNASFEVEYKGTDERGKPFEIRVKASAGVGKTN